MSRVEVPEELGGNSLWTSGASGQGTGETAGRKAGPEAGVGGSTPRGLHASL